MVKFRLGMLLAAVLMISVGGVFSQEKKDTAKESKDSPVLKGKLPTHWSKLGLTDDQKQMVFKAQAKYNEKIDKLKAELKALQSEEKKEIDAVLTAEQKKHLIELQTGAKDDKPKDKPKEPVKPKDTDK